MGFTYSRADRNCQKFWRFNMKYMQINLENFGGHDVEFLLSTIEFEARVKRDIRLCNEDHEKFFRDMKTSQKYVGRNIINFIDEEFLEGQSWDLFREAQVDLICKINAMNRNEKSLTFI